MITYKVKMLNGHFMWDAPMQKRRKSDKNARLEKKLKTYRRMWWWIESKWNQRHNIN